MRRRDHAPRLRDHVGLVAEVQFDGEQRTRVLQLAGQQRLFFFFRQGGIRLRDAVGAEQLVQGGGMYARVLPHVERQQVQPEQPHFFDQPVQCAARHALAAIGAQAVLDHVQVGQQVLAGLVRVRLQALVDQLDLLAVQLAGKALGGRLPFERLPHQFGDVYLVHGLGEVLA